MMVAVLAGGRSFSRSKFLFPFLGDDFQLLVYVVDGCLGRGGVKPAFEFEDALIGHALKGPDNATYGSRKCRNVLRAD